MATSSSSSSLLQPVTMRGPGSSTRHFWLYMLGISATVLVLVLGYAWYALADAAKRRPFPPTQALCPDRWTRRADGKCACPTSGDANAGILSAAERVIDPNAPEMRGLDSRRRWALKYRVHWDGVTN